MSEEVLAADSLLRENAELRRALDVAMEENEQRMLVERALRTELEAALSEIARLTAWQLPHSTPDWFWL